MRSIRAPSRFLKRIGRRCAISTCIGFVLLALLFVSSAIRPFSFSLLGPDHSSFHLAVTSVYLLAATFSLIGLHYYRRLFSLQLTAHVLVDVLVFTLLMHVGGGLRSGLGTMLLVTLAGAGLVGQGKMVLFYAGPRNALIAFGTVLSVAGC